MDYTPISARRVLLGLWLTGCVATLPLFLVYLQSDAFPPAFVQDSKGVDRVLILGSISVALTLALVALALAAATAALRLARRPTRA